ncbi:acetylglutamate kinase [Paenibacillus sp. N1-5-1-14]|uniref:acetylglutamate kinase n=1 Tax=Paenibacillus radicibacter TaxID=2972488 RepID=UPI00215982F9|nr:acetylglutamate kinase [Paenibacillus radicibacter]MCR8641834.1 acetylglutamate kinase [Paenibacillus radicibacter]
MFAYPMRYMPPCCITMSALQLSNSMRSVWEQHVAWTRMTIISIAAGLPDEKLVTERLLRNATDMAALLKPYYGNEIAAQFEALIRDHLVIADRLVKAAKAGNTAKVNEEEKNWYKNADDIVAFMNSINPFWPIYEMKPMFYEHLALTKKEAVARLQGNFAADIAAYDQIEAEALMMADLFTKGIIQQFPYAFCM